MNGNRVNYESAPTVYLCILVAGVSALCAGWFFEYERRAMFGVAIGCIPTGALGLALSLWAGRWIVRKHPEWIAQKRNAMDERSVQVRHHAGHSLFWALFVYLGLYTVLSPTRLVGSITPAAFGSATIILMSLGYWVAIAIYNRKY